MSVRRSASVAGYAEAGTSRSVLLAVMWKELGRYRCLSHTGRHEVGGGEEGGGAGGVTSSAAPGYLSQLVGHGLIILVVKASSLDPMRLKFQITFIHL